VGLIVMITPTAKMVVNLLPRSAMIFKDKRHSSALQVDVKQLR
jgi:hypothetical protein